MFRVPAGFREPPVVQFAAVVVVVELSEGFDAVSR